MEVSNATETKAEKVPGRPDYYDERLEFDCPKFTDFSKDENEWPEIDENHSFYCKWPSSSGSM